MTFVSSHVLPTISVLNLIGFATSTSETAPRSHSHSALPPKPSARPTPVLRGQLIYVRLLSRLSIEGYTAQALDPSHWEDASLLGPDWKTKKRPAVVLDVEQLDDDSYWRVKVLPLRRDVGGLMDGDNIAIGVSPQSLETGVHQQWPWGKIIAYAFPIAETFVCLHDQV